MDHQLGRMIILLVNTGKKGIQPTGVATSFGPCGAVLNIFASHLSFAGFVRRHAAGR